MTKKIIIVILTLFIFLFMPATASAGDTFNLYDFLFNNTDENITAIDNSSVYESVDNPVTVDDLKLYGFVIDADGYHLVNNSVYLNSTNKSLQTNSTDTGYYEFSELEPGLYNLSTSNIILTLEIPLNLTETQRCDLSLISTITNPLIEFRHIKKEKAKADEPIILGMGNKTTAIIDLTGLKEKLQPFFWPLILLIGIIITIYQAVKKEGSALGFSFGLSLIFIWAIYNSKIAIIPGV